VLIVSDRVGSNPDFERLEDKWEDGRLLPVTTFRKEGAMPPPAMVAIVGGRGRFKDQKL
jgi:hypothetical protein